MKTISMFIINRTPLKRRSAALKAPHYAEKKKSGRESEGGKGPQPYRIGNTDYSILRCVCCGLLCSLILFYFGNQKIASVQAATTSSLAILDADLIRVGLSNNTMTDLEYPTATVSATTAYQVTGKMSGHVVFQGSAGQPVNVTRTAQGFFLKTSQFQGPYTEVLVVRPVSSDGRLTMPLLRRKGIVPNYRGSFEMTPGHSGAQKFTVVNVLPLQDYLKAVVPNELPFRYGYEAVKAQAVAARNYAIRPREKPWPQFDICDSQYCQAYYGANTEHPGTTLALHETQGLMALYHGEPILALYSSSHGGYSENYENAFSDSKTNRFPGTPIPYLKGAADSPMTQNLSTEAAAEAFYRSRAVYSYDMASPNYRWVREWPRVALEQQLNHALAIASQEALTRPFVHPAFSSTDRIGTLKRLHVLQRGVSGKVMTLAIEGSRGTWTIQKEFVIRKVLQNKGKFLPSANVVFEPVRNTHGQLVRIRAVGGGFGHGVGMSQLGASAMSKHGATFVEILQHYYRGIAIGSMPLTATPTQGMKTEFYAPLVQGTLHVTHVTALVTVILNQHSFVIKPDASDVAHILPVSIWLSTQTLNHLEVMPAPGALQPIKAWVELYPASESASQNGDTGMPKMKQAMAPAE